MNKTLVAIKAGGIKRFPTISSCHNIKQEMHTFIAVNTILKHECDNKGQTIQLIKST